MTTYLTTIKNTNTQITIDDLYKNLYNTSIYQKRNTIKTDFNKQPYNYQNILFTLTVLAAKIPPTLKNCTDLSTHYTTFKIPKATGGFRTINAPTCELKKIQSEFKDWLESICKIQTHDAAHAYVKTRNTLTALKCHTESNYFLKLDIKDFFPGCNKDTILTQLKKVYPLSYLLQQQEILEPFNLLLDLCLLNNELPQGAPSSPTLTNILMIPFDFELTVSLNKQNKIYTRYADDLLISSKTPFKFSSIITLIESIFHTNNYPFIIKKEKTRYGRNTGANWNLGLMLNKDHNITIGHERKQKFRAKIFQFITDNLTTERKWSIIETQELQGIISYYNNIEPDYVQYVLNKYNRKFHVNIKFMIHEILK